MVVPSVVFSVQYSVFRGVMTCAPSSELLLGRLKHVLFLIMLLGTEFWILNTAQAKNLGVHGVIYPIEEADPIQGIHQKLRVMEERGELEERNRELQKKIRASIERPKPVQGITKATKQRVFYYDPSYVVKENLYDHHGRCFAKKDSKINPLEKVNLSQNLLFFDGDDEEQLVWVQDQLAKTTAYKPKSEESKPLRLILVQGAPLELAEKLGLPVYFDQGGILIKKLRIAHVPAIVSQEKLLLKIEEIALPPSRESNMKGGL